MADEWYYRTSTGRAEGPVTAAHMKQLAQLGEIGPETEIRKGAEGRWIGANKVKGLLDPTPPKPIKTAPPARQQPPDDAQEPEPPARPKSPAPLAVRRPPVDAETDDEEDRRPVPVRRPALQQVEDAEYTVASPARKRSPLLLVGAGVGGTLLVVGLVAVAFSMFGKEKPPQQIAQNPNEKQKVEPPAAKNNPPVTGPTTPTPVLNTPEATIKGYLAAGTWEERLPYVLNADRVRPEMAKLYQNNKFKALNFLPGTVLSVENRDATVGGKCTLVLDVSTSSPDFPRWTYILVRTSDGFKVDWEASQDMAKKEQAEALQAKLNPVIDIEVLRCKEEYSRTEIEFRLTNKSKSLFSYVGVTASVYNDKREYLGNDYTNETNVRSGQSVIKSISFKNVKLDEVASWKLDIKGVRIDLGDGQPVEATSVFKLNEQLAGSDKGYQRKLESALVGHWRTSAKNSSYFFSSTKPEMMTAAREVSTMKVIERNYSLGTVTVQFKFATGGGLQSTITLKDKTSAKSQITHIFKDDRRWEELNDDLQAKLVETWTYVDKKESP